MTGDRLRKILSDTEEIDPWVYAHFFQPLEALQEIVETKYQVSSPPPRYREARTFAVSLWECNDEQDFRTLAAASQEGAAQLFYLIVGFALERQLERPAMSEGIEPTPEKPYAALASRALEWLDEVEAKAPGKTQKPE